MKWNYRCNHSSCTGTCTWEVWHGPSLEPYFSPQNPYLLPCKELTFSDVKSRQNPRFHSVRMFRCKAGDWHSLPAQNSPMISQNKTFWLWFHHIWILTWNHETVLLKTERFQIHLMTVRVWLFISKYVILNTPQNYRS